VERSWLLIHQEEKSGEEEEKEEARISRNINMVLKRRMIDLRQR
jgi:hypothetical protein